MLDRLLVGFFGFAELVKGNWGFVLDRESYVLRHRMFELPILVKRRIVIAPTIPSIDNSLRNLINFVRRVIVNILNLLFSAFNMLEKTMLWDYLVIGPIDHLLI